MDSLLHRSMGVSLIAANKSAWGDVISVCCSFPALADKTHVVDHLCLHITTRHGRFRARLLNRDSLDAVLFRFRHCLKMDDFVSSKINVSCSVASVRCGLGAKHKNICESLQSKGGIIQCSEVLPYLYSTTARLRFHSVLIEIILLSPQSISRYLELRGMVAFLELMLDMSSCRGMSAVRLMNPLP